MAISSGAVVVAVALSLRIGFGFDSVTEGVKERLRVDSQTYSTTAGRSTGSPGCVGAAYFDSLRRVEFDQPGPTGM
jgi:hypothetical protein